MWNRLLHSVKVVAALLGFSCISFAQTYGTPGYSPGALETGRITERTFANQSRSIPTIFVRRVVHAHDNRLFREAFPGR